MKIIDINGNYVNVDVRQSTYPLRPKSKSKLQQETSEYLVNKYGSDVILEEFPIPGSRLSVDFFLPRRGIVVECDGRQHDEYTPFFHGNIEKNEFAKQKSHDRQKEVWVENNGFALVRIRNTKDLNLIP